MSNESAEPKHSPVKLPPKGDFDVDVLVDEIGKDPKVKDVSKEKIKAIVGCVITATRLEAFSGPLPHPRILKEYNDLVPGAADRIIALLEKQTGHRIDIEAKIVNSEIHVQKRGQWFGLIIAIILPFVATLCVKMGAHWVASILVGASLTGLVSLFIYKRKEKSDK